MTDVTAPAEAPADATATEAPADVTDGTVEQTGDDVSTQEENGKSKRNTAPVQVTVPLDLKTMIEKQAEDAGKTSARWVLELVAEKLSYTLPEAKARDATRPTALIPRSLAPEKKKERFDAARLLLAALDSGAIDLDAIKAKMQAGS